MSILLEAIYKTFGDQTILDNLSLEIESGELFVLLGSSGSGKSTLLRIIAGLTPQNSGQVILHGRDVSHLTPQKRGIGFVFQNYSLFKHMTVAANIGFALDVQRIDAQQRDRRVAELLALIDMPDLGDRLPWQLSGGQQQRVALARALAHTPDVLLLDEPFGALDTKIRVQLRQSLRAIQQRLGVTTILVTHDQEEAYELADRIGIIAQGRLLDIGTPDALYQRPGSSYTAHFLGSANVLSGVQRAGKIHTAALDLPMPPDMDYTEGSPVEIVLRPEDLWLGSDDASVADPRPPYVIGRGTVNSVQFAGALQRVALSWCADNPPRHADLPVFHALLSADQIAAKGIMPGATVWIGFTHFHALRASP